MNTPIVLATRQTFSGTSTASTPVDVSAWANDADFTLSMLIASSNGVTALVSIQDSADGFVNDIQTVATFNLGGGAINPPTDFSTSWKKREIPSFRVGEAGATARVSVLSPSSACAVTLSASIQ